MTDLAVPDSPKMLRETLCVAQGAMLRELAPGDYDEAIRHSARLQRLIAECDRHRPLGADGKHGDRHTATCGCEPALDPAQCVLGYEELLEDPYATWDPSKATDDPDGLPDRAIVPLVEELRARGIVTLQSCIGHPYRGDGTAGYDGGLWVRADSVDGAHIRVFMLGEPFARVQLVSWPERRWEFSWEPEHAEAAVAALRGLLPATADPAPDAEDELADGKRSLYDHVVEAYGPAPEPDLARMRAAVQCRDRCVKAALDHYERVGLRPGDTYARAAFDAMVDMIRADERRRIGEALAPLLAAPRFLQEITHAEGCDQAHAGCLAARVRETTKISDDGGGER